MGMESHVGCEHGRRPWVLGREDPGRTGFIPSGAGSLVAGRSAQNTWSRSHGSSIPRPRPWGLLRVEEAPRATTSHLPCSWNACSCRSPGRPRKAKHFACPRAHDAQRKEFPTSTVSGVTCTCGFYIPPRGNASPQT